MKLDEIDKKLLKYLYHNYRKPLTQIAKVCRISRDQVEYRIKKFESQNLIKKYITIFNYSALGYNQFTIVWLKINFKNDSLKKELNSHPNVLSTGELLSKYDLFVNFVTRDVEEFEKTLNDFLKDHPEIIDYSTFLTTYSELYPLKNFGDLTEVQEYNFVNPSKKIEISSRDLSIMKELEKNGRTKITDLAGKTKLSGEILAYKLKQLTKRKIILGNRIQFNMEQFGFSFATLRLKLVGMEKEKIKSFCKHHKHINALVFGVSDYNCIVQFFYKEESELRNSLREFRNTFPNTIQDSELLFIENESTAKTLPSIK